MPASADSAVRRAAVLGKPIAHSLSPVLHRAAYLALGLPWRYDAVECDAQGLPAFLAGLDRQWVGLSLTMPLKEAVLPLLAEVSDVARLTAAANTVLLADGVLRGENTDVHGIVAAVRGRRSGPLPAVCVIGAGATARSAVAAAAELGGRDVTVVARRPEAAEGVLAVAAALGLSARAVPFAEAGAAMAADLVVATVPGDAAAVLADAVPQRRGLLLDVTYWPWPTSLARAWGQEVVDGAQMLLWEAAAQVELMTGRPAPVQAMAAALAAVPRG